MKDPL